MNIYAHNIILKKVFGNTNFENIKALLTNVSENREDKTIFKMIVTKKFNIPFDSEETVSISEYENDFGIKIYARDSIYRTINIATIVTPNFHIVYEKFAYIDSINDLTPSSVKNVLVKKYLMKDWEVTSTNGLLEFKYSGDYSSLTYSFLELISDLMYKHTNDIDYHLKHHLFHSIANHTIHKISDLTPIVNGEASDIIGYVNQDEELVYLIVFENYGLEIVSIYEWDYVDLNLIYVEYKSPESFYEKFIDKEENVKVNYFRAIRKNKSYKLVDDKPIDKVLMKLDIIKSSTGTPKAIIYNNNRIEYKSIKLMVLYDIVELQYRLYTRDKHTVDTLIKLTVKNVDDCSSVKNISKPLLKSTDNHSSVKNISNPLLKNVDENSSMKDTNESSMKKSIDNYSSVKSIDDCSSMRDNDCYFNETDDENIVVDISNYKNQIVELLCVSDNEFRIIGTAKRANTMAEIVEILSLSIKSSKESQIIQWLYQYIIEKYAVENNFIVSNIDKTYDRALIFVDDNYSNIDVYINGTNLSYIYLAGKRRLEELLNSFVTKDVDLLFEKKNQRGNRQRIEIEIVQNNPFAIKSFFANCCDLIIIENNFDELNTIEKLNHFNQFCCDTLSPNGKLIICTFDNKTNSESFGVISENQIELIKTIFQNPLFAIVDKVNEELLNRANNYDGDVVIVCNDNLKGYQREIQMSKCNVYVKSTDAKRLKVFDENFINDTKLITKQDGHYMVSEDYLYYMDDFKIIYKNFYPYLSYIISSHIARKRELNIDKEEFYSSFTFYILTRKN